MNLPMTWRSVPGYPHVSVSSTGMVRIKGRPRKLCSFNGYLTVGINYQTTYVHRLVALAYLGVPDFEDTVNHIDGDRQNNTPANLEWVSRRLNGIHQRDVLKQAKLNRSQVTEIRKWLVENGRRYGYRCRLAAKFSCSRKTIDHVVNGTRWSDV